MMIFVLFISFCVSSGMHGISTVNVHAVGPVSTGMHAF